MDNCKIANQAECGKTCCCYECEERPSCSEVCNEKTENSYKDCEHLINTEDESKAIATFEREQTQLITNINYFEKQFKEMEEQKEKLHEQLLTIMKLYNIKSFQNENLKLTFIPAHTTLKFDSKTFQKENPELYEKYKKQAQVKDSLRVTVNA